MKKLVLILFAIALLGLGAGYYVLFKQNILLANQEVEIKIRKNDTWEVFKNQIDTSPSLTHKKIIELAAKLLKYDQRLRSGRYVFNKETSAVDFIRKLRNGNQDAITLIINNINFPEDLAKRVADKTDIDSTEFIQLLKDDSTAQNYGYTVDNFWSMFLPNSYQIYWDTEIEAFLKRMKREHDTFWNDSRKAKAVQINLTPQQVFVLASIVQKETNFQAEYATVASVYLNRLRIGMPLQADPTVKFALNDMSIKRILNQDLKIDSPYNTYKYTGLPPGPIGLPELNVVDGVLNPISSNYLYFCAVYGENRHVFTSSYTQHLKNAKAYQNELNKHKVFR